MFTSQTGTQRLEKTPRTESSNDRNTRKSMQADIIRHHQIDDILRRIAVIESTLGIGV